ncbi:hypothetical protein CAY60_012940 [Shouchella clausii]|uniref:Uncharacterized protein n=2 Tax=Shouchella TaxID=2893057 RepID=Q5WJB4_SHOC1|nr:MULTISPECIES: hypothetical protein [Shouchella]MCM3311772.1 hypothetical protein [Psychrobacillus sp. MER TA 17]SPT81615.1 Uncharacterised protein [Niallia circulans]ALA51808.1 hypothetical protein DB29_00980 [Shouchella clausii]MBU3232157.1 hypothetical protein [Shouchella clausii]MBU3264447.1 hypothetical protein [Shouchella clausii]
MAVEQVRGFVQNDGNFCQLDLQDKNFNGPIMRIETFRCSQPEGEYGVTGAGTKVKDLAGIDHLTPESNRIFRHVFSVGYDPTKLKATLEIRETFTESGKWEIRTRDLDPESASFGTILLAYISPVENNVYHLRYELLTKPSVTPILVSSPLTASITEIAKGLPDIGSPVEELGEIDTQFNGNPLDGLINWTTESQKAQELFKNFSAIFQKAPFTQWTENVKVYERMGDFRDKCIHPGTNLTGPHRQLASEFVMIRAYRSSLTGLAPVFDADMAKGAEDLWDSQDPLSIDTKPGVYTVFLSAYILNVGIHKLGLDKVHSDYGGVPMKLAPGSKLETGINPIVDSRRANQTIAEIAYALFLSPTAHKEKVLL